MAEELLKLMKGMTRTFVFHSNTNPYAVAAAMVNLAVRSQEAGPYFRVSDTFVPQVERLAPETFNAVPLANQVEVDFEGDWAAYLRETGLPACGLDFAASLSSQENTLRFLNAFNRRIPATKPRVINESRELTIPAEYRREYEVLSAVIKAGGDLKPYLSRQILKKRRPDRNDGLLNSWGIQHLHFRIEGTGHLLFCIIEDDAVSLIQSLPHTPAQWVNTQLIQIVHDNWPEKIDRARHGGLQPEHFSYAKRQSLRSYGANFSITVADGTVYLPPAGGTMASGHAVEDRVNCDKIFHELAFWESTVAANALAIRSALGMQDSTILVVRMAFDDRTCCFFEPTRAIRLGGFAEAQRSFGARPNLET